MAMLNFKKGRYSALPTTYTEGTVYVTTDEKAMYVDISSTERIRLGQIVTVKDLATFEGLKPPFSHEAFYYIVDDNALMRNNGTAESPNWTQINSTDEAAAALKAAQAAQEAAEAAQSTADAANALAVEAKELAQKGVDNAAAANTLAQKGVDDAAAANTLAQKGVDDAKTAKDAADAAQGTANEVKEDLAQTNVTLTNVKSTAESALTTATGAVTKNEEQDDRLDVIEAQLGLSDGGDGTSLTTRVVALENAVNDADSGLAKAHEKIDAINVGLSAYAKTADVESAIAESEAKMEAAIESSIAANDAMTYKGVATIDDNGADNLPDGILHPAEGDTLEDDQRVRIGDTYKVGKDGYYDGILCYVGDLLIANSTTGLEEEDGTIAPANLTWDHIESGYEDSKEPTLSAENGKIHLTSAVADEAHIGDLGTINVISLNESLKVSVAGNAITMSLEWGSFDTVVEE